MKELKECLEIYKSVFLEEEGCFTEELFGECFKYCRYLKVGDRVASMLFSLPCVIKTEKAELNARYIYAVATLPQFRGQGFMTRLFNRIKSESCEILFLRPANEELIDLYNKQGFKLITAQKKTSGLPYAEPKEDFLKLALKFPVDEEDGEYPIMYYSPRVEALQKLNFLYTYE